MVECAPQMMILLLLYYQQLFTTIEPKNIGGCIHAIEWKVSSEMNLKLLSEFIVEGISQTLKHMQPLKAPIPDGFGACFYQQNWVTIGGEVCTAILNFLNTGYLDAQINATHITLIPKVKKPTHVLEF
jgi:hypothetical protein